MNFLQWPNLESRAFALYHCKSTCHCVSCLIMIVTIYNMILLFPLDLEKMQTLLQQSTSIHLCSEVHQVCISYIGIKIPLKWNEQRSWQEPIAVKLIIESHNIIPDFKNLILQIRDNIIALASKNVFTSSNHYLHKFSQVNLTRETPILFCIQSRQAPTLCYWQCNEPIHWWNEWSIPTYPYQYYAHTIDYLHSLCTHIRPPCFMHTHIMHVHNKSSLKIRQS